MSIINPHDSFTWPIGYRYRFADQLPDMTAAQSAALRSVFDRQPLTLTARYFADGLRERKMTFGEFCRGVQAGSDCIMVYWCGMWLGIEPDGYTHS